MSSLLTCTPPRLASTPHLAHRLMGDAASGRSNAQLWRGRSRAAKVEAGLAGPTRCHTREGRAQRPQAVGAPEPTTGLRCPACGDHPTATADAANEQRWEGGPAATTGPCLYWVPSAPPTRYPGGQSSGRADAAPPRRQRGAAQRCGGGAPPPQRAGAGARRPRRRRAPPPQGPPRTCGTGKARSGGAAARAGGAFGGLGLPPRRGGAARRRRGRLAPRPGRRSHGWGGSPRRVGDPPQEPGAGTAARRAARARLSRPSASCPARRRKHPRVSGRPGHGTGVHVPHLSERSLSRPPAPRMRINAHTDTRCHTWTLGAGPSLTRTLVGDAAVDCARPVSTGGAVARRRFPFFSGHKPGPIA